jgi:hypothetical protein
LEVPVTVTEVVLLLGVLGVTMFVLVFTTQTR